MNEIFEKIYNDNNTDLNESSALFEKVYTEAEMLNEMNPKLRALLAAGLIGTASLGAASCSMPTDDPTIIVSEFDRLCANLFDSEHLDEGKEIIRKLKTAVYSDTVNDGNTYEEVGKIFIYRPNIGFERSPSVIDGFMYIIEDNSSDTGLIGYIIPTSHMDQFTAAISNAQ